MKRQTAFHNWFTKMYLGLWWQGLSTSSMLHMSQMCLRQELQGAQLADAWRVSLPVHFIRKEDYRGRKKTVLESRIRISFDALTTPGLLFSVLRQQYQREQLYTHSTRDSSSSPFLPNCNAKVACGLQVRGCKPRLQKPAMAALEVITGVSLPADYVLDLLPGNDE